MPDRNLKKKNSHVDLTLKHIEIPTEVSEATTDPLSDR